jgi:phosphatidylserine/phosphatidylglycerophosphate/cardiolipin synthase-like enzyme
MSANFFDVLMMWLGSGPSAPKYCQTFTKEHGVFERFGEMADGILADWMKVRVLTNGLKVAAPTNAFVWHVPNFTTGGLTDDEKAEVRAGWPPLRHLSAVAFTPEEAGGDEILGSILLEVFPEAFRRLEYLFSSLEVPVSMEDWDIPRLATPRWFWIHGFGVTGIRDKFQAIATEQWAPEEPPTIERFLKGLAPIYVDAGEDLGGNFEFNTDHEFIKIRAFDSTGLPIDPDFVFATFKRLAEDSDFARLHVEHPDHPAPATQYQPEARHVIVFCDQQGNPYTPRPEPASPLPPTDPEFGTVEADLLLLQLSPTVNEYLIPENGVLVLADTGLGGMSGPIDLSMRGTHVRLGTYPNGNLGSRITVDFAPKMFLRLQVLDYNDWFPRNPNPRNRLTRYTEGNLITPLLDGAEFFREIFRIMRATYKDIDLESPMQAFDPYAPVGDASADGMALAKIYLSNAWIEPDAPLLGRRGLITAPKTQDVPPEDLPAFDELMTRVKLVPAGVIPSLVDLPAAIPDQMQWWMVSEAGVLPAGACVEMRQLIFADEFHGDDPRLPGEMLNADIFGIVAPFPGEAASSRGFVSTAGRFAVPVVYAVGTDSMATLRITIWPPNSPNPRAHTYGQVTLPVPADFMSRPPVISDVHVDKLRLAYSGVPGFVDLVIEQDALKIARAVIILNPRSGEVIAGDHQPNPGAELRITIDGFAMQDSAVVGFLDLGGNDPSLCTELYQLFLGRLPAVDESLVDATHHDPAEVSVAALQAGVAPAHPTELAGLLREAISAGVDVRVLGWRDPTQGDRKALVSTLGTVNAINAVYGGRRGQAIWDATSRETFHVHHQKGAFLRTATLDFVGFLGGIDILNARWDTPAHRQPDPERPSSTWHDVQCKIEGKAAWDIYRNIMQRWNAAHALPDVVGADPGRTPLPPPDDPIWGPTSVVDDPNMTPSDGPHAAQINRTLAPHFDAYGGSVPPLDIVDPLIGDLSVKNMWEELLKVADRYLYIEDQYFWIEDHAQVLYEWLRAKPERFIFLVIPRRFADINIADQVHYALRRRSLNRLLCGVPVIPDDADPITQSGNVAAQVAMFHLASHENLEPIYVHSKLVIADDTWFTIGSANLTRRSWTFDSEINVACIDTRMRRGGHLGARQLRVDLLAEHLQLQPVESPLIEDPLDSFRLVKEVLAEKRPWMRTHLLKVDLKFTHYGPFPNDFDPILRDAIDVVADTDGTKTHFDLGLIDAFEAFQALRDATGGLTFGGLGRLRFTFDVSGLGRDPASVLVRVEMREEGAPVAQQVTLGPWLATDAVDAGLLRIGKKYVLSAIPLDATTSAQLRPPVSQPTVHATEFLTSVNVVI